MMALSEIFQWINYRPCLLPCSWLGVGHKLLWMYLPWQTLPSVPYPICLWLPSMVSKMVMVVMNWWCVCPTVFDYICLWLSVMTIIRSERKDGHGYCSMNMFYHQASCSCVPIHAGAFSQLEASHKFSKLLFEEQNMSFSKQSLVKRFYLQVGLVLLAASSLLIVVSLLQCYRWDPSSSTPGPNSHEENPQERNRPVSSPEDWSAEADPA